MSRALRRHHKERMKAKARRVARRSWGTPEKWVEYQAVRHADNLKACSCSMCCNVRRNRWVKQRLTIQEIVSNDTPKHLNTLARSL